MTVSVAVLSREDVGKGMRVVADLTFDTSYPAGGEALTGRMLGMRCGMLTDVKASPQGGLGFVYRPTNTRAGTLKVLRSLLANAIVSSPGLAIGSGSKAKILIANTVTYFVDGVLATKTTAEIAFTATTHDITADASTVQERVYLLTIKAGTVTVTAGTVATGSGNAKIPAPPVGEAVLGYVRIAVAAAAATFDATTDNLDRAGLTVAYVNANVIPTDSGRPLMDESQSEMKDTADLSRLTVRVEAIGR